MPRRFYNVKFKVSFIMDLCIETELIPMVENKTIITTFIQSWSKLYLNSVQDARLWSGPFQSSQKMAISHVLQRLITANIMLSISHQVQSGASIYPDILLAWMTTCIQAHQVQLGQPNLFKEIEICSLLSFRKTASNISWSICPARVLQVGGNFSYQSLSHSNLNIK